MNYIRSEYEIIKSWKFESDHPIVSIVCATYNHEKYIDDTIRGFLIQKTEFPFNVVIHDDASTDKTVDIINRYIESYPNIINAVFQKENLHSRGLRRDKYIEPYLLGKYIALCEGDDYWIDQYKLNIQVNYLEKNPLFSIYIHNAIVLNDETKITHVFNKKKLPTILGIKDILLRSWFFPTASFVYRKNYMIENYNNIPANGDILRIFNCALVGKIYYNHNPMSVYRYMSKNSLSKKYRNDIKYLFVKKVIFLRYALTKKPFYLPVYISFVKHSILFALRYFKIIK
ncbi:glycosyltransferase [Spirochaeta dissipatitropha]